MTNLSCKVSLWTIGALAATWAAWSPQAQSAVNGTCELSITGDTILTVHGAEMAADAVKNTSDVMKSSKVSAGSDYWSTDAQLRLGLESMIKALSGISFGSKPSAKPSDEEIKAKVDAAMKKDPRMVILLMNCGDETAGVTLGAGTGSHYADVPFKPGKYVLSNQKGKKGEFSVMMHLKPASGYETYQLTEPGVLTLTQFDSNGVAGTYSFKAQQQLKPTKKNIVVNGSFSLRCRGGSCH